MLLCVKVGQEVGGGGGVLVGTTKKVEATSRNVC